jgi:D-alanyl-D-alanine carboxypeptidase (penicillin-binding protein 5/6)
MSVFAQVSVLAKCLRALATATTVSLFAALPVAGADPGQPAGFAPPDGPAPVWLVADTVSGQILGGRDAYSPHAPASTIKALLAMVVFDELPLDAAARATEAETDVECSCVGLVPGQVYTARQLLDALLIVSGNDAANMLADMVGGTPAAVAKMNAKAQQVGATATRAGSPSGLDGPGWESVTTAQDLAVIYRAALNYPLFAQILHQPAAAFPDGNGGVKRIASHDPLLLGGYPGFIGGKTGYTNLAQETYVAMAQRNGRRLIAVMMYGKDDLWDQGRALLDWGFARR